MIYSSDLYIFFFRPTFIDLEVGVREAQQAIHYFFNNQFDEARNLMAPW